MHAWPCVAGNHTWHNLRPSHGRTGHTIPRQMVPRLCHCGRCQLRRRHHLYQPECSQPNTIGHLSYFYSTYIVNVQNYFYVWVCEQTCVYQMYKVTPALFIIQVLMSKSVLNEYTILHLHIWYILKVIWFVQTACVNIGDCKNNI